MKVQQVSQIVSPFGGLPFVVEQIKRHGIDQFLDEQMGKRSSEALYKYSDGILATAYSHLCGSSCIEDINTFSEHIGFDPHLKLPSADTVLRMMNELKTETKIKDNEGVLHQVNLNDRMNKTLIKFGLKTGMINADADNTLDYDNVILEHEKYDAAITYKMNTGYQPGVAAIGKQIVFIEGRGGNTPASYNMGATLRHCFDLLKENNIHIQHFRSDSAAYQQVVINTVKEHCTYFYIRADDSKSLRDAAKDIPAHEWQTVMIGNRKVEIADTPFFPFGEKTAYRVVVQRSKRKDCQGDLFTGDDYTYYGIITNNEQDSNLGITNFYNARGASEKNFDILNNDFNCNRLPFSFLDANIVYLYIAAISSTLFEWIKKVFCEKQVIAGTAMRIKKFLFEFMLLPCKWIKTARQWVLKIYTTRTCYKVLLE